MIFHDITLYKTPTFIKKTVLLVWESDVKLYNTIVSKRVSLKNLAFNDFCPTFRSKPLNRHLVNTYYSQCGDHC